MEVLLLDQNCVEEAVVVVDAAVAVEAVVGSSCLTFKFSGYCATIFMVIAIFVDVSSFGFVTHGYCIAHVQSMYSRYMNIACLLLGLLAST